MIPQTQINAYKKLRSDSTVTNIQFEIINYLLKIDNIPTTRNELEAATGIRINNICGRTNELLNKDSNGEERYIYDNGQKYDNQLFDESKVIMLRGEKRKCRISELMAEPVYLNIEKQINIF